MSIQSHQQEMRTLSPHTSFSICCGLFIDLCHSHWGKMKSQRCFYLCFPNWSGLWTFFIFCIYFLVTDFLYLRTLCSGSRTTFWMSHLCYQVIYIYWISILCQMYSWQFLSLSVSFLFALLIVSFAVQRFLVLLSPTCQWLTLVQ